MRRTVSFAGCLVAAVAAGVGAAARQASSSQTPTQNPPVFRAGTNVVPLEVIVLDRNRKPVTDLTASDFTIRDNGQVRPVTAFSAVQVPEATPPSAAWMNTTVPDVATNQAAARRIVVVVFNDQLPAQAVQAFETMTRLGHAIIDQLGPADLASVVYLYHPEIGQPFTTSHAALEDAIERVNTTVRDPDQIAQRRFFALDQLTQLVDSLAAIPDRQKVVFVVGDERPSFIAPLSGRDALYRAAARANVTINCLALGLVVPAPAGDFCKEVASNTDGDAVVETNDPIREVPALVHLSQSYYVLGFEPEGPADASVHRIAVTVNRPDVDVRTRRTYEAANVAPTSARAATDAAYASAVPLDALALRITAIPVAGPRRGTAAVLVGVTIGEPNVRTDVLQVEVGTQTADGSDDHGGRETVRWTPRATPTGDREATLFARVDLPPGYHELRAAVESAALKRTGSVLADVDIPDFDKAPLSLSGIAIHTSAAEVTVGTEAFRGWLAEVPTTRREFTGAERVSASFLVYQGGSAAPAAVTLSLHLTNDHDEAVFGSSQELAGAQFAESGRRVASSFAVPLDRLPAGRYLLTIEATAGGQHVERDVPFSVR